MAVVDCFGKVTKNDLLRLVDDAADLIRTSVDYKYILVLLFIKRLSDRWKEEVEDAKTEITEETGIDESEAVKRAVREEYHSFMVPENVLWDNIKKDREKLTENLSRAINEIAKENRELDGVVNRIDFIDFTKSRENRILLEQLFALFDKYNFSNKCIEGDAMGDAYEHILMRFAPEKAKEGEVYTPREVVRLMVDILDPQPGMSVYDPACGSGGMLIEAYEHVKRKIGEDSANRVGLYGEERSPTTYALAKMNMILHGISESHLDVGDSLLYPKFKTASGLRPFDLVLANPPWTQKGYGEQTLKQAEYRDRYSYGYVPKSYGDWAWIQHMLYTSKSKVAVIMDQGVLFRGNSEYNIRRKIVDEKNLEAVILLPEKIFYNTDASGVILIFNKNKDDKSEASVLFIDASKEFTKHPEVRKLNALGESNIQNIISLYNRPQSVDGVSKKVSIEEIKSKNYNLIVNAYVGPVEKEEEIDIQDLFKKIGGINDELGLVENKLSNFLEELGYIE
ncbi:MAG: type I restriction-modification system subunit M [Thermoplasmataceae archaeon]